MPVQITLCKHCHDELSPGQIDFCCAGCETVYNVLSQHHLSEYYALREALTDNSVFPRPQATENDLSGHEEVLDTQAEFYIQGMHCGACVWLIEQLPFVLKGVEQARVDLSTQKLYLTLNNPLPAARVMESLARWGYKATPLQPGQEHVNLAKKERLLMLWRMGVAAFASGNLMILSLSFYAGLTGNMARYFEFLSLILFLPVFCFSAWPFFEQGVLRLCKTGRFSADLPIAISLLAGTAGSIYEMFWGTHQVYFDSLSMLVFLLLCSRYLLLRTQQRVLSQPHPHFKLPTTHVMRKSDDGFSKVPVEHIAPGDILRFFKDQTFVADGVITEGHSRVDQSLLTGEPYPVKVAWGDTVFRGTTNQQNVVDMRVTALGENTRLGRILEAARHFSTQKSRWIRVAENGAKLLSVIVICVSAVLLYAYAQQPHTAFSRLLALSIVACPCGLALATPLILHLALRRALNTGIFIKYPDSIEKLPTTRRIVLDKTGTLTQGLFKVLRHSQDFFEPDVMAAVLALESHSRHPVAAALMRYIQQEHPQTVKRVDHFEVLESGGIAGNVDHTRWSIQPVAHEASAKDYVVLRLEVRCEGKVRAEIQLGDAVIEGVEDALTQLKNWGYELFLLSGDTREACVAVAHQVGIPLSNVRWQQSPEDKATFLQHPPAVMVGDGLNDLTALSCAEVGVSVRGGLEENVNQCDVYLAEQGVLQLPGLLKMSRHTRRLLFITLGFALSYNVLVLSLAACGWITPLAAAILMPLSALIVIGLSVGGQQWKF